MIEIEFQTRLNYVVGAQGADFVFNVHAAQTPCQTVAAENLVLSQPIVPEIHADPATGNRYLRFRAQPGELNLDYTATVRIEHHLADPDQLAEVALSSLPPEVMGYMFPSRYCQSDRLLKMASDTFGDIQPGYARVKAIRDWVLDRITYASNTSDSTTSAVDTLVERVGVCRDFAHLMIAFCRALNIPARIATGTDFGSGGQPDFHAYVEVFLGGRWFIFDPSDLSIPMGLLRIGTGRDAADVAFASIFGEVKPGAPLVRATAVEDEARGVVLPRHCSEAISTAGVGFAKAEVAAGVSRSD